MQHSRPNYLKTLATVIVSLGVSTLNAAPADTTDSQSASPVANAVPSASNNDAYKPETALSRWFDINTFNLSLRYRSIFDVDGVHTYDQAQQRSLLDGRFKFDREGKYSIGFHFSSGHYFDWAYADFIGGGTDKAVEASIPRLASAADRTDAISSGPGAVRYPSGGWAFLPRQLYFSARPVSGVELQYGSIGINRGLNSEITSYDEDGYMAGGRLILTRPDHLFFDEVSVTYAYLGDILTPNFIDRYQRLGQSNYHQFLVRKKITPWLEASTDYTRDIAHTMREAVVVNTKRTKAIDDVRFEAYQRMNSVFVDTDEYASGNGFAISADKRIGKKVNLQAGFASVDGNYDVYGADGNNAIWAFALNGDQYGVGKRPFVRATVKLTPYLNLFGFYTHLIDFNYDRDGFIWNQTAFNAGLTVDFKNMLKLQNTK